ncbi:MAG: hypothetical protein QM764_23745 [Chitinophagaceae bacterium]
MKWLAWIVSCINLYFAFYFLLNFFNVLQSSKYSQRANIIFGALFITLGIAALYTIVAKHNYRSAVFISIWPWILSLAFLFLNMIFADYK